MRKFKQAMQKIKVAYICTPIEFGGAERVSLNFFRHVNRDKFEIIPIFLIRPWEPKPLLALNAEEIGYKPIYIPVATKLNDNYFRILRVARELFIIFRENQFDIVHSHGYFTDICSLLIAKITHIPCISTCHGFIKNNLKLKLYNFFDKVSLLFASRVIAVSDNVRDEIKYVNFFKRNVVILPNAVPVNRKDKLTVSTGSNFISDFGRDESKITIGYVGRLSKEKGVVYLLAALGHDILQNNNVRLVVIGEGDEGASLHQSARELGVADRVFFLGFRDNVEELLSCIDVFVLPSLTEGTPMALLEAMAHGVPVIATNVGGVPDVIRSEYNGLLVEPKSSLAIARSINKLINNIDLRKQLSNNGMKTIEDKYGVDSWCYQIEDMYQGLIM